MSFIEDRSNAFKKSDDVSGHFGSDERGSDYSCYTGLRDTIA